LEHYFVFNDLAEIGVSASLTVNCQALRYSKNWYQMLVEH